MNWHTGPLAGFDLETTGPDPEEARIVTAALPVRAPGVDDVDLTWLADPGIDIPERAAAIHGITTERARADGRPAAEVVAEVIKTLRKVIPTCPVVIFNAAYDLTVLDREARRHGLPPLDLADAVIIDPHVLDKAVDRYRKGSRKLDACCEHYQVKLDSAHDACCDALAAMRVAWRIGCRYQRVAAMSGRELMEYQRKCRRAQAAGLAEHFARQGKPEQVNGDWPVQMLVVEPL
jgi:DNA polymerase III subunit epsilon